jgi:hypothetical protein
VTPAASRTLTIIAATVLGFDGAALMALGLWSGRVVLTLVGLVYFASAVLVLLSWRWYRRRLSDIASARRVLSQEAREMQRSLHEKT